MRRVNWRSVILYYVLACAFSWPFFWWRDMNSESWRHWDVPRPVKTASYMWGPGLAAIVSLATFRRSHPRRVSIFGRSATRSITFFAVPFGLLLLTGVSSMHRWQLLGVGLVGFAIVLGEELGWRGFLQDALYSLSPVKRYMLIGALWEFWHFTNRTTSGQPLAALSIRLAIFYAVAMVLSLLIGEAVEKSLSISVAVTMHWWINAVLADFAGLRTTVVFLVSIPFWIWMLKRWSAAGKRAAQGAALA